MWEIGSRPRGNWQLTRSCPEHSCRSRLGRRGYRSATPSRDHPNLLWWRLWACLPSRSQVVSSVGEVQALVHEGKVSDDVVEHRRLDGRPVGERSGSHLVAEERILVLAYHDPVHGLSPMGFPVTKGMGVGFE